MATTESDYYELLGVPRTASDADIKGAFRTLARELHPDVSSEPDADVRFRDVAEAYEVLSDPERRATYGIRSTPLGAVGLVGPVRMDYEKAIRTVRAAAFELSRFVEDVYEDA